MKSLSLIGIFQCIILIVIVNYRYKAGSAEKQGKRLWATRYLMIVGCRLLVYRYPINKKRGNANIPLNVIDLTNALIEQKSKNIISINTHRKVIIRKDNDF